MPEAIVMYLDVDGVANATSSRYGFGYGRRTTVLGYRLTLSRRMGERLIAMDADIRWLSTWGGDSELVGRKMGLPGRRIATEPPAGGKGHGIWKFECVRSQVAEEQRPFCWIDDEAITPEVREWASGLAVPSLLISTQSHRGMTPADADEVEAFISSVKG
jgi:hypothetical protein